MNEIASGIVARARETLDQLRRELLAQRHADGHWTGQLAGSALSTATAVSALARVAIDRPRGDVAVELSLVDRGVAYLRTQQNADGGFGDTDRSYSNIATSYLVLAASALAISAGRHGLDDDACMRLRGYIAGQDSLDGLRRRYGTDKTFVVPIMTNLAIAGLVSWDEVPRLPFEAAAVPQSFYRLVRMPVVSYAIPALVAIGQARHFHGRATLRPLKALRAMAIPRTMRVLAAMQPESGGYLEATPLTSFVVMSLAATGRGDHAVSSRGVEFLRVSISDDGSWPIDTNLATWLTSLSLHALCADPDDGREWCDPRLVSWLLRCQHRVRHPFTGASPGGWGWTDLSGAVPDGDDTPAAMIALLGVREHCGTPVRKQIDEAVSAGAKWLIGLQNRDGGWPTFCRGWGKLPFDRSSTDLTAHAIRALRAAIRSRDVDTTIPDIDPMLSKKCQAAIERGQRFLVRRQGKDGGWLPLWFGNQDRPDDINPVYGTARVLMSIEAEPRLLSKSTKASDALATAYAAGCRALIADQNIDGGWGGGDSVTQWWRAKLGDDRVISTMEETAVAVEGLCAVRRACLDDVGLAQKLGFATDGYALADSSKLTSAILLGVECLLRGTSTGLHREPWPIGFYFAKLWYHEKLYPWVFTVSALGKFLHTVEDRYDSSPKRQIGSLTGPE